MNEFQLEASKHLLDKLAAKPIARMILSNWTDLSGCLTFDDIRNKLHSSQYASLFDFYLDLRLLIELRDPVDPRFQVANRLLEDILEWVTRKVLNLPRSKEERDFLRVKKLLARTSLIVSTMVMRPDSASGEIVPESETQAFISPKTPPQAGQRRIEALQQRIERLRTPEELQTVLHILQKHIPQFSLTPEVVIEARHITRACANELKAYLNSVNA
jgi:hypothetical protein